jgi:dATP pyrophosphohydrolase
MTTSTRPWKIPESVLVVIHTPALDVLLIRRADANEFWQSVTGSKDVIDEPLALTAAREVAEETGIECGEGTRWRRNWSTGS